MRHTPDFYIGRMTITVALCNLELENHRRVVRLLLKALGSTSVPASTRIAAALEIKERRELIDKLLSRKEVSQDRRSKYKALL